MGPWANKPSDFPVDCLMSATMRQCRRMPHVFQEKASSLSSVSPSPRLAFEVIVLEVVRRVKVMLTLWLFNIAMGNGPFVDGLLIKMVIFHGYVK